ncbi:TonB-dependent receptor domain-containing protein [Taibaiella lutea]|nr:TonB-dependent receptor [Taibaiella lutea]
MIVHAQYNIQGDITDSQNNRIGNAVILLLNAHDSTLVQTFITDEQGRYLIVTDDIKNKIIKVNALGFSEVLQPIEDITSGKQTLNFTLKPEAGKLSEVVVTGTKKTFERKIDRIVFNVSKDITTNGENALEVVKKSPGVIVRQSDNTISLAGKGSVSVMINDRLLQLSGEDLIAYLQAIPADNIDRIEVITAPPAKYDASGNSGLINIVLKRQNKNGIQGNIRAGYEQASYGKGIAGGDINYRIDRLNVYANANYTNGANHNNERLATPYPEQIFKVHDDYKKIMKPLQYTVGADYNLNKKSVIGFQWNNTIVNRKDISNSGIEVYHLPAMMLDSTMLTKGGNSTRNSNNLLNLNYTFNIDTSGKKISFDANSLWFDGNRSNDFETTNYYDAFKTPTGIYSHNKTTGKQTIQIKTIQTDIELPYQWVSLSIGGKLSFINNQSNNAFGYIDDNGYHEDPDISNGFDYKEKVQALYMSAQRTINKWSFQAGLRGEFTQTKGYSRNLNQTNINQYFNLFPTAFVQYQLNDDNIWNINYSKRINRPGYRSLDPYRSYATPYHYSEGNPFLQPSFNHNFELNYTFKSNYSLSAFYQYEKNHFSDVWMIDETNNITSSFTENFADAISYGLNGMASINPFSFWDAQIQAGLQIQELQSKIYTATEQSYKNTSYYIGLNNAFKLNKAKTLLAELNVYYLSKYREDFLEIKPLGNVDAGLKALLFDKNLSISLNASDILVSQKARGVHIVTGQVIDNYFDTRNLRLTLQYRFGNNRIKSKRERNLGIEEEKQRM